MPDLNWIKVVWDTTYGRHDGGEEWSPALGGSEAQWFSSIFFPDYTGSFRRVY
jgi:hypothetical protein